MPNATWAVKIDWNGDGLIGNIVTNGAIGTGTGWTTYGGDVAFAGGKANFTTVDGDSIYQTVTIVPGRSYTVTFTVSGYVSGGVLFQYSISSGGGLVNLDTMAEDGTYSETFTAHADATGQIAIYAEGELSVDDVSLVDAYEDVSSYVTDLSWRYGRDRASSLTGQVLSLSFEIQLLNSDGRFNSFLASGPLYGMLLPGRKVQCESVYSGTTTTQFVGYISSIVPQSEMGGNHVATITGFGPIGKIRDQSVSVALQTNLDTGSIVSAILTAAGWPVADRVIDTGATVVPYYYATEKRNVLDLIRELETSEGGCLYETKDGKIGFESRMRRRTDPYGTSQATLTDAAAATLGYDEIVQNDPIEDIFNKVTASVSIHELQAVAVLWTLEETGEYSPSIAPSASKVFWTEIDSDIVAVQSWTTPAATTDFLANTLSGGNGTNITSDIAVTVSKFATSMKITLTNNNASTAYITFLQARGIALAKLDGVTVQSEDATSQGIYGIKEFPIDAPWLPSSNVAQGYCDDTVADYKDPNPVLTVSYRASRSSNQLSEALDRDFGDRVTLVANGSSDLGINGDFYVEAITHSVGAGGTDHRVQYELSSANTVDTVWVLGTSVLGTGTILADIW